MLGDRLGHTAMVVTGLILTRGGVIGFGVHRGFVGLLVAAALIGIGGALHDPAINVVLAAQPAGQREQVFTLYNQLLNLATMVGPVLGGWVIAHDAGVLFLTSGTLFFGVAGLVFLARRHYVTPPSTTGVVASLRDVLQHKPFVAFNGVMTLFWILFAQLTVALPLYAYRWGAGESAVSAIMFSNGLIGLVLMFGLQQAFHAHRPVRLVRLGALCAGVGLSLTPLIPSLVWVLVCVSIYTVGETLVLPGSDLVVAELSADRQVGTFWGVFDLSWAIGGAVGTYLGTWLLDQGGSASWPWLTYAGIGAAIYVLMQRVERRYAL
jgi:MFS family permease